MAKRSQAVRHLSVKDESQNFVSAWAGADPEPTLGTYCGIFLISAAVLLFELALTRIFSVVLWSNLAFMVVSTALFGFGLSGVFLALKPTFAGPRSASGAPLRAPFFCLLTGLSIVISYAAISYVPFRMWQFESHPENYLSFAVWEVALLTPFFFAGVTIASIMSSFAHRAGRLYGVDLLGAAVGSGIFVFIITALGGVGTLFASAVLAVAAALSLAGAPQRSLRLAAAVVFLVLAIATPGADENFPIRFHQRKRQFDDNSKKRPLLATRWSSLSRVDIADDTTNHGPLAGRDLRAVWIDGGTNESVMLGTDGKSADDLPPQNWSPIAAPYFLADKHQANVLVIGSAGGRETLIALTHGARHVDAVEMDPSIVHFVGQPENAEFMGHVYQNPRVTLTNDEGRAFLRRKPAGEYDVIQSVNNYTPVAMASGALNLSETFLITREAFHDYLDHLTPNGMIALHRGAIIRVALTAMEALRERGVAHPEQHIVIANGDFYNNQSFFLKKSPWTREELHDLGEYLATLPHFGGTLFLWTPFEGEYPLDPYYANILRAPLEAQKVFHQSLGLDLTPTTDDKPFIEHYSRFGVQQLDPGAPLEFQKREDEKWKGIVPRGDFPYVVILGESALLALLFVGMPLLLWARDSAKMEGFLGFIGYFAALGFGFVVVEICLMKRYVLFLGHPAYSITTILVSLLCGAGVGSLLSESLGTRNIRKAITFAMCGVSTLLLAEMWGAPAIFAHFLNLELGGRFLVAAALLFPLGVFMGMPFTLGITLISRIHRDDVSRRKLIAWAWGINGYTTVIGSALTVFLALYFGFTAALITASVTYLLGLMAVLLGTARAEI
ncbi:MAG: hypothetical protein U0136_14985 [Bdellovibrionota bacterium]